MKKILLGLFLASTVL